MEPNRDASVVHHVNGDANPSPSSLDSTKGADFVREVKRAEAEAADAAATLEDMRLWVERLQPYFERDRDMTVAQALQLYLKDRPKTSSRSAKSAGSVSGT